MKKKGLVLLLAFMMFFFVGCGETKKENKTDNRIEIGDKEEKETPTKEEVKTKTFTSDDGKIKVTFPNDWKRLDQGELNEDANLEAQGTNKYFMNISDNLDDFDSFNSWYDIVLEGASKAYSFDKSIVKDVTIGSYNAKSAEFTTTVSGLNIYMRVYYVQTKSFYSQIYLWTTKSNSNNVMTEFDDIIQSYVE